MASKEEWALKPILLLYYKRKINPPFIFIPYILYGINLLSIKGANKCQLNKVSSLP
nr:MAG TPA: hypothetical protein [Caudoviricetes sp.]